MIKKLYVEADYDTNYDLLTQEQKKNYGEMWDKLSNSSEEYIIAIDLASPNTKDYSVYTYWKKKSDGTYEFVGEKDYD